MLDIPEGAREDAEIAEMLRAEAAGEWGSARVPRLVALAERLVVLSEIEGALALLAQAQAEAEEEAEAGSWLRRRAVRFRTAVGSAQDPSAAAVDLAVQRARILIEQGRPLEARRVLNEARADEKRLDRSRRGQVRATNGHALMASGLYGVAEPELMAALLEFEPLGNPGAAWEASARRAVARLYLGVPSSQVGPIAQFINLLLAGEQVAAALTWAPSVTRARLAAGDLEGAEQGLADLAAWTDDEPALGSPLESAWQLLAVSSAVHGRPAESEEYLRRSFGSSVPGTTEVHWLGSHTAANLLHVSELAWLPRERAARELGGLERWLDLLRSQAIEDELIGLLRTLVDLEVEHGAPADDPRVLQANAYLSVLHGDLAGARARLDAALDATRAAGGSGVNVLHDLAIVERRRGDLDRAGELLVEAGALCDPDDVWVWAGLAHELASVRGEQGDVAEAARHYTASARLHERFVMPTDALDARRNLAFLDGGAREGLFVPFRTGGFVMAW